MNITKEIGFKIEIDKERRNERENERGTLQERERKRVYPKWWNAWTNSWHTLLNEKRYCCFYLCKVSWNENSDTIVKEFHPITSIVKCYANLLCS